MKNVHEGRVGDPTVEIEDDSTAKDAVKDSITYGIDDAPPFYICFFMAIQHYLTMVGAIISIPFILTPALCMDDNDPARGIVISTMVFVTGVVTFFQATFGCRLPLVQGGTISFLVPTLALLNLPQWKCPSEQVLLQMNDDERTELWQVRMRELSGAIAVSALVQVVIGYTGLVGKFLKIITPLTIMPTISMVGLSLFEHAANTASKNWLIAMCTIALLTLFSQILVNVNVPTFSYSKDQGFKLKWFPIFKLFPVLLAISIMWGVCAILTAFDVFAENNPARTDGRIRLITQSAWFRIPYPGQFGIPTISLSGVLGMLAGVLACTVESISYYPTVAKMCNAPPPPLHAINRGIGTEGLGTVIAGLFGAGNGTNTFGENVGAIGVTKVGSRRVIQWAAGIMIIQGVLNKFGTVFILIPDPIVGGIFNVMFGMICAFGLSALQYVDLRSSRNLYIIGLSLFFPMVLCQWIKNNPNVIQTGNETLDSSLSVILGTSILVGGFVGCLLDHIIPGTPEERGLIAWNKEMELKTSSNLDGEDNVSSTYDFPCGMTALRRWKWTQSLPFSPTYRTKKSS